MERAPRITIGMPVYNGERHIARAIESILAQSYGHFLLIVLDNASTDQTGVIARSYAMRDPRVIYRRNPHNIGAGPNFNRVFALARSPYFKWAAHDDELHPRYLAACLRPLEEDEDAILAHSLVEEIDDVGRVLRVYKPVADNLAAADPLVRFRSRVLERGWCTEVFGLVRTDRLHGSALIASFAGADLSLIAELSLRGRFLIVPEPLFRNRVHSRRYTSAIFENLGAASRAQAIMDWYDTSRKRSRRRLHWWLFLFALFAIVRRNVEPWRRRLPYYVVALRWIGQRENRRDLGKDLLFALSPSLCRRLLRSRSKSAMRSAEQRSLAAPK